MGGGSSEVTRAQEKLQEAIAKRDANVCTAEEVELAKLRYEAAQDEHQRLSDQLEAAGCTFLSADRAMVPTTTVEISDPESVAKVTKLLDWLEDYDDVQEVYHDADLPDEEEEE